MTTCNTELKNIILTRYLYNKIDVKQSLLLSLLEHNYDQALFWGYELYYSGFKHDVFIYLSNIYDFIYSFNNPTLREPFRILVDEWKNDNSLECHLGTIIMTLSTRTYDLKYFIRAYFNFIDFESIDTPSEIYKNKKTHNLIIRLKENDINKYKNIKIKKTSQYLQIGCKYPIRKELNNLFNFVKITRKDFENHWLYYCRDTPYWIDKILEFDGAIDYSNKQIVFPNDTLCDKFYDKWNIEPDDQPQYIYDYCIGYPNTLQLSVCEFYNKYNPNKKTNIDIQPILVNSIVYT
jgi:hypothetical protein